MTGYYQQTCQQKRPPVLSQIAPLILKTNITVHNIHLEKQRQRCGASPTSWEVRCWMGRAVITLISSSVDGRLWSFQGGAQCRWKSELSYGWLSIHFRSKISFGLLSKDKEKIISSYTIALSPSPSLKWAEKSNRSRLHWNKYTSNLVHLLMHRLMSICVSI